jgi:serine/threonine protein kinase
MTDLIGRQIDKYRVEKRLGEGGMGTVYQACDVNLSRRVALKVMHRHLASQPQFRRRFLQEAQVCARLGDHRSIVTIYEYGPDQKGDLLYLAMELVLGGTLRDYVKRAKQNKQIVAPKETLYMLAQVADALDYAHRRGAIHRDIKPSNILVRQLDQPEREGEPPLRAILTDFGLAKLLKEDLHTQTGTFVGTLPYMSPEQCLGEEIDGRSDIYSLGVVLYQLTTGQLPYDIQSPTDAVRKHQHETPLPPRQAWPGLPPCIETIILKATARDQSERFQTGAALALALRQGVDALSDQAMVRYAPPQSILSLATALHRSVPPPEPSRIASQLLHPAAEPRLVMGRKGASPRVVPLHTASLTIGRADDNDLVVANPAVSRRHARIDFDGSNYQITDLNSTNRTYLDSAKLLPGVPEAWPPDKAVRVGDTWLYLVPAQEWPGSIIVSDDGTMVDRTQVAQGDKVDVLQEARDLLVEPGGTVRTNLLLHNHGPKVAHFRVTVRGIPAEWITLSPSEIQLMPGEQGEVTLTISPPRCSESQAGDYDFVAYVSSDKEVVKSPGKLTVAAYTQFSSDLHPQRLRPRTEAQITVENQGNEPATATISFEGQADDLTFDPQRAQLTVPPGQSAAACFHVTPRQRRWFGSEKLHSFTAEVELGRKARQSHRGEVVSKGLVPAWAPPLLLVPIIALCLILGYLATRPPVINSVTHSPPSPEAHQPVTVYWDVDRAHSVDLSPLIADLNPAMRQYTFEDGFDATVSLIVVASNRFGTVEFPLTVPVLPSPVKEPTINKFAVDPQSFVKGEVSTVRLTWDVLGADMVSIEPGLGPVGPAGSRDLAAPARDTVYTLVASNQGGETRAEVQVSVAPRGAPSAKLTIHPEVVVGDEAQTVRLIWETERAETVKIEPGIGPVDAIGSLDISVPPQDTTYTLTAGNENAETKVEAKVKVEKPQCTVVAKGLNLRSGPGTDFEPPITALAQGTKLDPLAFYPGGHPEQGWLQVQVAGTGQRGWVRARDKYVRCNMDMSQTPPPADVPTPLPEFVVAGVTAHVSPIPSDPRCPKTFSFFAEIIASGPGTATYRWERSNGDLGSLKSITFNQAGTKEVTDSWVLEDPGSYWIRVRVQEPNVVVSNQATFNLTSCPPATADFVGDWINADANTRGMTRLIIEKVDDSTVAFHGYGKCHPTDCEWDNSPHVVYVPSEVSFTPPMLVGTYQFTFKKTTISVERMGEDLRVEVFDDYTEADGRTDRTSHYVMRRR